MRFKSLLQCIVAVAICPVSALWAQTKFTVAPENQPVDGVSADTWKGFSSLNELLAGKTAEPAASCLKSYAVYQACKGDDSATCGAAPTCKVTALLPVMDLSGMELLFTQGQDAAALVPRVVTMNGKVQSIVIMSPKPPAQAPAKVIAQGDAPPPGAASGVASGVAGPIRSSGPARISGGVSQGLRTSFVQPSYPPVAKAGHMSGTVVLQAIISKEGSIQNLGVMSASNSIFDNAAIDAVRLWRYKPYILNGEPSDIMTTITVNFALAPPNGSNGTPNRGMGSSDEHGPTLPH